MPGLLSFLYRCTNASTTSSFAPLFAASVFNLSITISVSRVSPRRAYIRTDPYELYLQINEIEHTKTKVKSPCTAVKYTWSAITRRIRALPSTGLLMSRLNMRLAKAHIYMNLSIRPIVFLPIRPAVLAIRSIGRLTSTV